VVNAPSIKMLSYITKMMFKGYSVIGYSTIWQTISH